MANIVVLGGGDIGADFWTKKGRILMEGYSSNTLKSCKDIEEG